MTSGLLPADVIDRLRFRHSEAQRHYHTWAHIEALLTWLEQVKERIGDRPSVELAILFHDAVYDPRSNDSETRSAALMTSELSGVIPRETLERAKILVLATAGHRLPDTADSLLRSDCAFFLDMDLSILGAAPAVFDNYEDAIRREYVFVPAGDYREGRGAVLRNFLDRDRLYFTRYFRDRLERQARANLKRSIARLERR